MLSFFLLLDVPTQALLLSPFILWVTLAPKWHPAIVAFAAVMWTILAIIMWRTYRRRVRAEKARELPQGDWRWHEGVPVAHYAQQVRLFLHNYGWADVEVLSADAQGVTLSMRKDRLLVVMRCLRGDAVPDAQAIEAMAALKRERKAQLGCLMMSGRPQGGLVSAAATRGVEVMRLQDMTSIDDPEGPAGFAKPLGR